MFYNNILETIGNTPLVKINKITKNIKADVYAKLESFNPGNSIKDRIGVKMIEDAEKKGMLKPGGTIIEGTSGNTGMGLAIAAIIKGYKCIFTTTDKQSKEKIDILKAVGAEVIVCPTNVAPDDPRSYYSVAEKLSKEIPNSFYPNQYFNLSNRAAHYESTGPEIWKQTEGKITHFVAGVGTGGTISGTGKYLKEQNQDIQILGIDTYGSIFKKYHETGEFDEKEIYPYLTEGIGEDILPDNVDFSVIDYFEKVSDKDAYVMTRRIVNEEGILAGNSCGAALAGVVQMADRFSEGDLVIVIFPDHASRYIGKVFNDEWMRERGFLLDSSRNANDILNVKTNGELITIEKSDSVYLAIQKMRELNISQMPVSDNGKIVGSVTENDIYSIVLENPDSKHLSVANIMKEAFPEVDPQISYSEISRMLTNKISAVIVKRNDGTKGIITKYDILQMLTK